MKYDLETIAVFRAMGAFILGCVYGVLITRLHTTRLHVKRSKKRRHRHTDIIPILHAPKTEDPDGILEQEIQYHEGYIAAQKEMLMRGIPPSRLTEAARRYDLSNPYNVGYLQACHDHATGPQEIKVDGSRTSSKTISK